MRTSVFCSLFFLSLLFACGPTDKPQAGSEKAAPSSPYLNHNDSAKYVGMNSCRSCHQDIYNTFLKTGMGSSFGLADKNKSAADFSSNHIYDKFSDLHYQALWENVSLHIMEFRLLGHDTVHKR